MSSSSLFQSLNQGRITVLTAEAWEAEAPAFAPVEEHETHIAGKLLVLRGPTGLVAVESPRRDERVVRPLRDEQHVREFVADRLETYDRMWDGCGCKVDYYA